MRDINLTYTTLFFYTNETIPKVTVVYFSLNFTHFCRLAISHAPAPPTFSLCFENEQIEYAWFLFQVLCNVKTKVKASVATEPWLCNLAKILIVWFLMCTRERERKTRWKRRRDWVFRKQQFLGYDVEMIFYLLYIFAPSSKKMPIFLFLRSS